MMDANLRQRLIDYANCNRCELTPDDARQIILALESLPHGPNDEQVWLEDELMACMQIVAPGMGSAMPDEITYAIMVTAIRRLIECDTDRYEALLERWQKRHPAAKSPQEGS